MRNAVQAEANGSGSDLPAMPEMASAPREIFARYVQQRRRVAVPGFRLEVLPGLTRLTPPQSGLEGLVMFSDYDAETIEQAIDVQLAYFKSLSASFEWKIYDFDRPANLATRLLQRGFVPGDSEAFMVYPTAPHRSRPFRADVQVRTITSDSGIRDILTVQNAVWPDTPPGLEASLRNASAGRTLCCAYQGDRPVGTGWTDYVDGSEFADLHGGAVLPDCRGRGIYSALFDVRAEEARRRGVAWLAVDAAPMSRPILLRQGFQFICETIPFHFGH